MSIVTGTLIARAVRFRPAENRRGLRLLAVSIRVILPRSGVSTTRLEDRE